MKVVILAGGYGTRLAEYTKNIPKPMVRVKGKPIIQHIINHYKKFGFKNKEEFFKNRYDKRWNIIRHVPNNKLEKLFKDFIEDLHNQPKSTGNKRAKSSITTYISQIKKWEKDLNKLIGSSFELTLDVKKTLSKTSQYINLLIVINQKV